MWKIKRMTALLLPFLALPLLAGCTARELEDRAFAQAMELDLRDGRLWGGFGSGTASGETVAQIQEKCQSGLDVYLDLGHVRAVVLGKALAEDRDALQKVLLELEQIPLLSRNSLVFVHEYQADESYLEKLAEQEKPPGEYLADLYRNNPYRPEEEALSLGDLLDQTVISS